MRLLAGILTIWVLSSCSSQQDVETTNAPLFELMDNTGIHFRNDIQNSKDFNIFSYRNYYNGGGVAIGDVNNDGLPDVFFSSNMGSNKLFINKGSFHFEDVSDKAGIADTGKWSTGVVMADINADGWLDIYVCNAGINKWKKGEGNQLFINNRNGTFSEKASEYGLDEKGYTTHAAFFDYDLDGDLDCYILNNSFIPVNTLNYSNKRNLRATDWPVADFLKGGSDKLLRNDNGKFKDVSEEAGIYGSLIGFGLGITVGDVNGDHYPDMYVSNDFFERDYLYINQQNGKFSEQLEDWMQHISMSSMGADIADVNNDGYPDLFTTDMLPDDDYRLKTTTSFENIDVFRLKQQQGFYNQFMQNTLQINNQDGKFKETGFYSGVAASDWSWGGLIFDADNDGNSDLYICNGIYHDLTDQDFIDFFANDVIQNMVLTGEKEEVNKIINKMPSSPIPNKLFRNKGNLQFEDMGKHWGLNQPSFSNGAAYADLDNDGDLDFITNNVNAEAFVYKNLSTEKKNGHSISVTLKGKAKNTFAIGSTLYIFQQGQIISRELIPSRGFQSSVDYKLVAGLKAPKIDSLWIIWPDRTYTSIKNPPADTSLVFSQTEANGRIAPSLHPENNQPPFFTILNMGFEKHEEDDYIDFYYERNIPEMLSREGPRAATGDVNGDALDDIYVCGAKNQPGQLYLQTEAGKFVRKPNSTFDLYASFEDVTALFFDADKDNDLDLLVGSGGNTAPAMSREYQNRLYKNDGNGNFTLDAEALPVNNGNTSCTAVADFDNDGDLDLFVGSRSQPQNYGMPAPSYLLQNNGKGKFSDVSASMLPELQHIGMVTAATWADVNNDKIQELILTGEWMSPMIFTWHQGRFNRIATGMENLFGWWQSLLAADMDDDGDMDLVMGNIGENFYLHPTEKEPVKIFINDFDGNGNIDKVITRNVNGKDVPVFLKRDLTDQVPGLKKQNLKFAAFATKSVQELFPEEQLKTGQIKEFNYAASVIAYNDGKGNFTVMKLPQAVQLSSMNAIVAFDVDHDGRKDLLMGGNKFGLLPQFCRLDASFGEVLLQQKERSFKLVSSKVAGFAFRGEIRDIKTLTVGEKPAILWLQNNDFPRLTSVNR